MQLNGQYITPTHVSFVDEIVMFLLFWENVYPVIVPVFETLTVWVPSMTNAMHIFCVESSLTHIRAGNLLSVIL